MNESPPLPEAAPEGPRPPNGVREELAQLLTAVSSLLSTRVDLARIEYLEARQHTIKLLVWLIIAAVFLGMAFLLANGVLIAAYWDTPYRFNVIGGMAVAYLMLGVLAVVGLCWVRRHTEKPFAATLGEFEKDRKWLAMALHAKAASTDAQETRDGP